MTTFEVVRSTIAEKFGHTASVTGETTAEDVNGWDSLSHAMLIADLEGRLGVRLRYAEIENLRNVDDLVAALDRARSR